LASLAVVFQLAVAWKQYSEWELDYPGSEWIPTLMEETGDRGVLVTGERWEWDAVQFHTMLIGISPTMPQKPGSNAPVRGEDLVMQYMRRGISRGNAVGVTRSFWESEDPRAIEWQDKLREDFGEPVDGRRPEYLLFEGH
jgi:hypothetical protein